MRTIRGLLKRSEEADGVEPEPPHERCLSCGADLEGSRSYERYRVCHACGFHFHLTANERLATLLDPGSFAETDRGVTAIDPLSFAGRHSYRSRVINAQRRTGLAEAALTGTGTVFGRDVVVAVLDFAFLGGSIGVVAGERLARAFEKATARRTPLVTVCSTSGTRMQEGLLALMQVPRVIVAARRHAHQGLPHVAVLTDPTTGSAYSGFVNLADYALAEPNALLGYAALRVVQEQEGHDLPPHAHTSESHLEHGLVDAVVPRDQLRDALALVLDVIMSDYRLSAPENKRAGRGPHTAREALQQLELSRHEQRPTAGDFVGRMLTSFVPIRGDRMGSDDPAILAGFGSLAGEAVVVVGENRPHGETEWRGWIGPAGFRKATRALRLAGKFQLPVITLIDSVGALPSLESEEAGLGHAIAECTGAMLEAPVPTIAVITGEGSSEAAVALAAADRVLMLDNAVYEVIRPEDAAKILYQEPGRTAEVAERMRITSHDCLRLGVVDATVPEPGDGAHTNHQEAAALLRRSILRELTTLQRQRPKRRLERRYERYRHTGSTRSWLRGTLERRLAHLFDRIGGIADRLRGRAVGRRRGDYEDMDIAV
ncbi:MAG: acetyl-CoA carboxylase carboxyltransferase subunit alpha/beta [Dehalococcoidia bacterium]|nr:acetyl-CoA carboxylase carboxyltransferase subunit alpha/beta [Dehalococcoidia bacterium]